MQLTKAAYTFKAKFWEYNSFDRFEDINSHYNFHYKRKQIKKNKAK